MAVRGGRKRTHQVDVHVGQLACRHGDGLERRCRVLVDLPPLALLAVILSLFEKFEASRAKNGSKDQKTYLVNVS
jgi:hypothetical protein